MTARPSRYVLLALIAAIVSPIGRAGAQGPGQAKRAPNVLFILSDDQRADTIAALGNPRIHTPHLDRIVQSGFTFHRAYCMGSMIPAVCLPSRTMLLTGRTLFHIDYTPDIPMIPKTMRQAGYATLRTGKEGNHPEFVDGQFDRNFNIARSEICSAEHADNAIEFIHAQEPERPFFLYVAFASPHDPRIAPREYMDRYDPAEMRVPADFLPLHPFDNGEMTVRDERLAPWPRTEADILRHLADYYGVITYMDAQVGRILAALDETRQLDRTMIVFSSDHGLAIGSHGLMGKQNLYEHSMRVPLVFAGPGIPRGQSSQALVYLHDIFRTICELAGIDVPGGVEGKSLVPVLRGELEGVRGSIFTAYRPQRALCDQRWKLIRYTHVNRTQLFDLSTDPHETVDLSGDVRQQARMRAMMDRLQEWQAELGDELPLTSANPADATFVPPAAGNQ